MARKDYPTTPDGRYFVARGRLWRKTDPRLDETKRRAAVKALMRARLAVRDAPDEETRQAARREVDAAKRTLGERGPVWWEDGAPDEGQKAPWNSSYAQWWEALDAESRSGGE